METIGHMADHSHTDFLGSENWPNELKKAIVQLLAPKDLLL
jgi:hypothetical protein